MLIVELVRINKARIIIIISWRVLLIDFRNVIIQLNGRWYLFLFFIKLRLILLLIDLRWVLLVDQI